MESLVCDTVTSVAFPSILLFFSHSTPFVLLHFLFPSLPSLVFILLILLSRRKPTFPPRNAPSTGSSTLWDSAFSSSKCSFSSSLVHFFTSCIVPYNTPHGCSPQNPIIFFLIKQAYLDLTPNLYLTSCVTLTYLISLSLICQYWKIRKNPCFHLITVSSLNIPQIQNTFILFPSNFPIYYGHYVFYHIACPDPTKIKIIINKTFVLFFILFYRFSPPLPFALTSNPADFFFIICLPVVSILPFMLLWF